MLSQEQTGATSAAVDDSSTARDIVSRLGKQYPQLTVNFEYHPEWNAIPFTLPDDRETFTVNTPWTYDATRLAEITQRETGCSDVCARAAVIQCEGDIVRAILLIATQQEQQKIHEISTQ